jgi:hypothetical protein
MRDETAYTDDNGADTDDCRSGTRNRYFRGKTMKADDFEKEQRYGIGRRRLLTRSVLGWGVVYGLAVEGSHERPHDRGHESREESPEESPSEAPQKPNDQANQRPGYEPPPPKCADPKPIAVAGGLAIDRHGREIDVHGKWQLAEKNTFLVEEDANRNCRTRPLDKLAPGRYLLSIHYAERRFGDANLPDGCGCDQPEKKYVCETAVFSLRPVKTRRCPCGETPCNRTCKCGAWSSCGHGGRGPHACLCEWTADSVETDTTPLCEWRGYDIDPQDGVPLACVVVEVQQGKCDLEIVGCIEDDCGPRRLVKSNDLLYDLIRGCDLARISWISWARWHRSDEQMSWKRFESLFEANGSTDFVVRFSQPVLEKTLKRDVITINAVTTEQATGWRVARRIPVVALDLTPEKGYLKDYADLPKDTTNQMRVKVRPEWVRDEIERGRESWLSERDFRIEIEIYGDYILDCHGQAIDANQVGLRPAPTGNGSPGGTYRSNFRVQRKQRSSSGDDDAA